MIGLYLNNSEPPKDVQQQLSQFAYSLRAHYYYTGAIIRAL